MKKKLTIAGCLFALCAVAETCLNYSFQNSNTGAGINGAATPDGRAILQIQSQIWKVTANNVTVAGWWSDKD